MQRTAWAWLAGLALTVTIACSGETTTSDEAVTPEVEEPARVGADRLIGSWKVALKESRQRRLAIIDAALSSVPLRATELGKLGKDEKDLYETWARKKGRDVRTMEKKLRMTRSRYVFQDGRVTVQVNNDGIRESYGPVDYEVLESSDDRTVVRFDPGMGNGYETHTVLWAGADRGADRVTANGQGLIELPWIRD
ncbi:MAG: hypothetical protein AAF602_10000 [Myxococcota bacterium]